MLALTDELEERDIALVCAQGSHTMIMELPASVVRTTVSHLPTHQGIQALESCFTCCNAQHIFGTELPQPGSRAALQGLSKRDSVSAWAFVHVQGALA